MKNYQEFTAPEGQYYHKDNLFAKALILPLSVDINEYTLATEEEYQKFLEEQKLAMEKEVENNKELEETKE